MTALSQKNARNVGGVSPSEVEDVLRQRYRNLLGFSAHVQQATAMTANIAHRLAVRSAQLDRIMSSLSPGVYRRVDRQQRRRDEIYRHVSQHLRDVQELCETREEEAKRATDELAHMVERERLMSESIAELAEWLGLDERLDLDEVEKRVREIKVQEDARDLARMF